MFEGRTGHSERPPDPARAGPGRRLALMMGGALAAIAVIIGGWVGTRLFLWGARRTRHAVRFGFAVVTLRLLRRCPDCKSLIRADARVCKHCAYRTAP